MRQLPVINAFTFAVSSVLEHAGIAFRISWAWFAIIGLANIVVSLWQLSFIGMAGLDSPTSFEHLPAQVQFASFVVALVGFIGFASIAVAWHRFVLLDEVPQESLYLRLDGTVWRYVGNIILISLILVAAVLVVIAVGAVFAAIGGSILIAVLAPLMGVVCGLAWARLSIKLPSIAIERSDFGFRDAWRVSENNSWRLFLLYLLYFVCLFVASLMVYLVFGLLAVLGPVGIAVLLAAQLIVQWVFTIVGVGLITTLYGFFAEGRPL